MKYITLHDGRLLDKPTGAGGSVDKSFFRSGLPLFDRLSPGGGFSRAAMHEFLMPPPQRAWLVSLLLARASGSGAVVLCDPDNQVYPPAIAAAGLDLSRVFFIRASTPQQRLWAINESLRCGGVSAVVGVVDRLSRLEARRLVLSAERGGGVGLLLRPAGPAAEIYAAATRWLVGAVPGRRSVQRWKMQLIHGHGGQIGQGVYLEVCRETGHVRAVAELADQSRGKTAMRLGA